MPRSITLRQLHLLDVIVLRDLVRFGVLANDQIDRRYGDPALAATRLPLLVDGGLVEPWAPLLQDTAVYSATAAGAGIVRCGLRPTRPSLQHLRHDVAVVDLADAILRQERLTEWKTEREVASVLRGGGPPTRTWGPRAYGHKPDGLLLLDGQRLAIELEHTDKGDLRYAQICRWFALSVRVDGIRWYVDDPKIIARIRRVNAEHGFANDVAVTFAPFPPGVAVRPWVRARIGQ